MEKLLDKSIDAKSYQIHEEPEEYLVDLTKIDFDKLRARFATDHKRTPRPAPTALTAYDNVLYQQGR